ncbi:hypothetical protein KFZ70_03655 [Tamlana fucoidanivorans]|uniref:TonB family protein n=1 Tax=Allotamlana fucoidanivorans TaxID=2583814 RepID=A0A5C4SK70_9FLAO|nr:hypothetical protein FGF67_09265 [Tamlana fucoidanivorans]
MASESYYELEPEKELTEEELKVLEALENMNKAKAETNNAFNENQETKHFAQAYKRIAPPEDYVPKSSTEEGLQQTASTKQYDIPEDSKLDQEDLSKFSKVNDLLKKQNAENNNAKSSISFSLLNRNKVYIPIPVYLCEVDGKIVVNINVNAEGDVTDAYLNTSSTSKNDCLIQHALEYAKQSQFSADPSKESQLGSITFYFIGKR